MKSQEDVIYLVHDSECTAEPHTPELKKKAASSKTTGKLQTVKPPVPLTERVKMSRVSFGKNKSSTTKHWVHPDETLLRGHIVYNVKFLGFVDVDVAKGAEIVKDAIRKLKFNKHIRKAEGQKKLPKVELTVSVDGVTVQEPKNKVIQHQFPLHRISYCADDKSDKKMVSFIAKSADSDQHHCFVFDSDKCAEEITLTIGQAFDLAYKKFLENSYKDMDLRRQFLMTQKKVNELTQENVSLKARVADLERLVDPAVLQEYEKMHPNKPAVSEDSVQVAPVTSNQATEPVVGRKLENLLIEPQPHTNGASKSHPTSPIPALSPPPVPSRHNVLQSSVTFSPTTSPLVNAVDVFGQEPFNPGPPISNHVMTPHNIALGPTDPFGMDAFGPSSNKDIDQQIQRMDMEMFDLQTGFSRGLSFAPDDFSLEDLDPLNKK